MRAGSSPGSCRTGGSAGSSTGGSTGSMTGRPRRFAATAVAASLVAAVSACGPDEVEQPGIAPLAQIADSDSPPAINGIDRLEPDAALEEAIQAMDATGSYRVKGTTMSGSEINIRFKVGAGSRGKLKTDGGTVKIRSVDDQLLVSGDAEQLSEEIGEDIDDTIGDKWLLMDPNTASVFEIFASGEAFAEAVLGAQGPGEVTSVKDVDEQPAVGLVFPETGGTLWVAASGKPYPLRFEEEGATAERGVLKFSDFGEKVKLKLPDDDNIVGD